MKKFISFILCIFPIILLSLTFDCEKINEFAVSGDYGNGHRLFIEDNFMYALSHYGLEIHTVDEVTGELNRLSVIPIEGDADDLIKIGTSVFVSVSSIFRWQDEILSAIYKIDVSDPYEAVVVDSIIFPENIKNYILRSYGGYLAYHKLEEVNENWFFTQLVFVDPNTFEEVTSFPIETWTEPLRDNYFLRQRNPDEYIFDVYDYTDIFDIQVISFVDFVSCPTAFLKINAINDSTLVLWGNESISIYDISNLLDIQIVSTYYRYDNISPCGNCIQIDNFLLIPSQSAGIEVVDIADIENPILFEFWEYPIDELTVIDPRFITLSGIIYDNDHLYVGSYDDGILLMNINDGIIEYIDNFINNRINTTKFSIYNNYLITSGFSGGLYVYSIENVNAPELITILFEDLYVRSFEIINNHIYLIYINANNESDTYFKVCDISDIESPILRLNELLSDYSLLIINENELDNIYLYSFANSFQSYEMRKYDIANPENIEQILFYEFTVMIIPSFFYEGYLYALEHNDNGGINLYIFDGLEEENPVLVNQINNFSDNLNDIHLIKSYLNLSPYNHFESDSFYNLDNPINPELAFTIQNTSMGNCYFTENVLFSPSRYTVFLYNLEGNPSGELESFDYFNLYSQFVNIAFYSQNDEDYFLCTQLECISTYNYSIETSAEDELPKPELTLSNYPNPFNPETTISFSFSTEITEDTEISIYNIKGQKVDQLEITNYELGINEVTWDAKGLASGIYMYQLKVDGKTIASKKCLLLK